MKLFISKTLGVWAIVAILSMSQSVYSADVSNGNACIAANLSQAFELNWNQARVSNPATNANSRFVTCTLSTGSYFSNSGGVIVNVTAGEVVVQFEADAAADAEAACIFRQINSGLTSNGTTAGSVVSTLVNGTPGTANTVIGSFFPDDGLSFLGLPGAGSENFTLTCLLDPGVGINAFHTFHAFPLPPAT